MKPVTLYKDEQHEHSSKVKPKHPVPHAPHPRPLPGGLQLVSPSCKSFYNFQVLAGGVGSKRSCIDGVAQCRNSMDENSLMRPAVEIIFMVQNFGMLKQIDNRQCNI